MEQHWQFEDIEWSLFDPQKVDPDMLRVIKAAGIVEHNGADYGKYLKNVFAQDPLFLKEIDSWVADEVKHGQVLAAWVQCVEPDYDFDQCFANYVKRFPIDVEATQSIRGSCGGELLTRCMVEIGTSSYYTAIKEAAQEPLLKHICSKIAADELRHYKLFYTHFQRYQVQAPLSFLERFRIGLGRLLETDGDELATAYYTANEEKKPYNQKYYTKLYGKIVSQYYRKDNVTRAASMFCKAIGVNPQGWMQKLMTFVALKIFSSKAQQKVA